MTKAAQVSKESVQGSDTADATADAKADRFYAEQRSLLEAERAVYLQQLAALQADADQIAAEMEPGDVQFDEESGEGGTLSVERERDLALSAKARGAIEEIDQALVRLEKGTYGICSQCAKPIKRVRLKALPYASMCVECKTGGLKRR